MATEKPLESLEYIITTRGFKHVLKADTHKGIHAAYGKLRTMGYKRPLVFVRLRAAENNNINIWG